MAEVDDGTRLLHISKSQYIPLPLESLIQALLKEIKDERDKLRFIDLSRRLHHLYRARITNSSRRLRKGFEIFTSDMRVKLGLTKEMIEVEEDSFIENFHKTMMDANFQLLTQDAYNDAINSEYTLNLDLEMRTEKLDTSFLHRFLEYHESDLKDAANVNRKVLVYHRGYGLEKSSGFFLMAKDEDKLAVFSGLSADNVEPETEIQPFDPSLAQRTSDINVSSLTIIRRSLDNMISAAPILTLFQTVELQEPTFREMVVLYRDRAQKEEADQCEGIPPLITVKAFKDIPVADFEIILPAQEPRTRAFDLVKVIAAIVIALITVVTKSVEFYQEADAMSNWRDKLAEALPLLIIVGTYASKIIVQLRNQQATYIHLMTNYLYQRTTDSGDGLRAHLEDSTIMQEVKEALLAFFFLWQGSSETTMTLEILDSAVEEFLHNIDHKIDFEVDDAVRKLVDDGLVKVNTPILLPSSTIKPLSISRAISKIEDLWNDFFVNPSQECPFCPFIQHE